jgi:hypothetical protein
LKGEPAMAFLFVAEKTYYIMKETNKGMIMKQFGRNAIYIYKMKRLGYPLIGIYRGW